MEINKRVGNLVDKARVIAFDLDDTLAETFKSSFVIFQKTAEELSLNKPDNDKLISVWGSPFQEIVGTVYPHYNYDLFFDKFLEIEKDCKKNLFEGVRELLLSLVIKKTLALVSNRDYDSGKNMLVKLGIYNLFEYVKFAGHSGYKKPDPRVFSGLIEYFKHSPEKMVYIGDNLFNYQAATGADLKFIGVTTGLTSKKDFQKAGCKFILSSLVELKNLI